MKKSIKDLGDIRGKRALVRVDINVPLDENKNVTDDTRIQAIVPTVNYLKERGAKIILMAHLGRPKGEKNPEFTLAPVAKYMSKVFGQEIVFIPSVEEMIPTGEKASTIVEKKGLSQISDEGAIKEVVEKVVNSHPAEIESYRNGKTNLLGFFVGQVMKETKGRANPKTVNELVRKILEG